MNTIPKRHFHIIAALDILNFAFKYLLEEGDEALWETLTARTRAMQDINLPAIPPRDLGQLAYETLVTAILESEDTEDHDLVVSDTTNEIWWVDKQGLTGSDLDDLVAKRYQVVGRYGDFALVRFENRPRITRFPWKFALGETPAYGGVYRFEDELWYWGVVGWRWMSHTQDAKAWSSGLPDHPID